MEVVKVLIIFQGLFASDIFEELQIIYTDDSWSRIPQDIEVFDSHTIYQKRNEKGWIVTALAINTCGDCSRISEFLKDLQEYQHLCIVLNERSIGNYRKYKGIIRSIIGQKQAVTIHNHEDPIMSSINFGGVSCDSNKENILDFLDRIETPRSFFLEINRFSEEKKVNEIVSEIRSIVETRAALFF